MTVHEKKRTWMETHFFQPGTHKCCSGTSGIFSNAGIFLTAANLCPTYREGPHVSWYSPWLSLCICPTWINVALSWVTAGLIRLCSGRLKHGLCLQTEMLMLPSITCYKIKSSVVCCESKPHHRPGCQRPLLFLSPISHQQDAFHRME